MSEQFSLQFDSEALGQGIDYRSLDDLTESVVAPRNGRRKRQKYWTWSLKAGGCWVWFRKKLQLSAFHLLSSDPTYKELEARPFLPGFPHEDLVYYRMVIGTRGFDGNECLWAVETTSNLRPDDEGGLRPRNWHLVQDYSRRTERYCNYLQESAVFENARLIENWKRIMPGVKKAHEEPDFALRDEICALAEHPEGISIEQIGILIDASPKDISNEVCWLIHENRLLTDLNGKPFNDQYIVQSTRVH